ncbi:MAG TPA: ImmA/IrrE family metallo-endopeptidase [Ktedonobacterales bacterium]|nr:ImmA/IrrE family metallo-endopeptidase [Ktedonobacterales bacterium]
MNNDDHDNEVDQVNRGWPYFVAVRAQASGIPVIVLHRSAALSVEIEAAHLLAGRSVIAFDTAPIVEQLRDAIAENFSRVQVTYLAERRGWVKGMRGGVLEAFTYDRFPVPLLPHTPGDRAWIQRSRVLVMQCYDALIADYQTQVARATKLADDIINNAGYTTFPIPVEKIVKDHGLIIRRVHLDNLSGRIKNIGETGYIEVNEDERATRQSFTIAHEFGHWAMSHGQDCFRSASTEWVLRPTEDSADAFAASLLMPTRLIKREFERLKELGHTYDAIVRDMARACHVGERAMRRRLRDLGLFDWRKP